jgi:phycoerythrobilin:ferredoxin oxidoreductase
MKSFSYSLAIVFYFKPFITQSLILINHHSKILSKYPTRTLKLRKETKPRRTTSSSSCNNQILCQQSDDLNEYHEKKSDCSTKGGTYRRFAEYAWEKILQSGLLSDSDDILPDELATNSSPAKGFPEGSAVNIELKCVTRRTNKSMTNSNGPLRLARYALLETLAPDAAGEPVQSVPQGIHVLNLVLFPDVSLALPVLGVDLVTLPGGKHLMAIDFQPIVPPQDGVTMLFPQPYEHYRTKLEALHQKFVLDQRDVMPWGGDLPPQAQRFFSPYALWTRIQEKQMGEKRRDCQSIIEREVFDVFCAYFDLYLEMMMEVTDDDTTDNGVAKDVVWQGHVDYLNYRRDNDPARPMLTRLYGEDYAESVIRDILFQMI